MKQGPRRFSRKEIDMTEATKKETSIPISTTAERRKHGDGLALFENLQEDLARLWGHTWPLMPRPFLRPLSRLVDLPDSWAPSVDVFEKNGDIVVKAELPGIKKEDVKLSVDGGNLVIEGERHAESEVTEKDYYRMERSFGSFYRRLPLPEGITAEQVKASFVDGVLEVHVPKPPESAPSSKKIAID